jgi:RNA polymerase sigma factor (sigma-70 family)
MFPDHDKFMERIDQIYDKLYSYSRYFANEAGFVEADDLLQESLLKLWERYCKEPDLLTNNNSYITWFGLWMMRNLTNHVRYTWVNKIADLETEKGDIQRSYPKGHYPSPEGEAIREEVRDIARQMPSFYQGLYNAFAEGYETKEIAARYKVSKWTINSRRNKMIQTLSEAWRVPPNERNQFIQDM